MVSWEETPRCPKCQRWIDPGQRHLCNSDLARCTNPHCRRLLPYLSTGLCIRCQVKAALSMADGGPGSLPVNTGRRPRRR